MNDRQMLFRPLSEGRSELQVVENPGHEDPQVVADQWPEASARLLGNRDLLRIAVGMARRGWLLEELELRSRKGRAVTGTAELANEVADAIRQNEDQLALALLAEGALRPLYIAKIRLSKQGASTQVSIDKFGRTSLTPVTADSSEVDVDLSSTWQGA